MEASRQCAICCHGIDRTVWTKTLYTVSVRNDDVEIGILHYDKSASLQESSSLTSPGHKIQIRLIRSPYAPFEVFLIHRACYLLLCELAGSKILPQQAFKLFQAMQPNLDKNFGPIMEISLPNCPDPSTLIIPRKCLFESENTTLLLQPDTAKCGSSLLWSLPPEILQMILEYLLPSDLVRVFRTSKWALSYANLFCRSNPLHFYRCNITATGTEKDKRILMIALSTWDRIPELDVRWQIVKKAAELARLLPFVDEDSSSAQKFSPQAPLQPVNHRLGLCEDSFVIPLHAKTLTACSIQLEGKHYVCGIGFDTEESTLFFGHETKSLHTINISSTTTETIGIAVDALGVRSIKYGTSPWLFGDPRSICCWEGLSVRRGRRKIRAIHDELKLRYLSWDQDTPPLFEETLLMKNRHPSLSSHGFVAEEYYVRQHPDHESELVDKSGKIPVEAVWFDRNLQGIKMYAGGGLQGISGLSLQTPSESYSVGTCHIVPTSITLHTPYEVLAEIDVRTSEVFPLAITLRTNYNRELSSEPRGLSLPSIRHTIKTLRPPRGSHIIGLYFRLEGMAINSIGMIISSGRDKTICADPNQPQIVKVKYRQLYQGSAPFNEFLSEFIHLATEAEEPVLKWKEELYYKLSYDIKDLTKYKAMDPDVDFTAFSKYCCQIATHLQSNGTGWQQTTSSNSSQPANSVTKAPNGPVLAADTGRKRMTAEEQGDQPHHP